MVHLQAGETNVHGIVQEAGREHGYAQSFDHELGPRHQEHIQKRTVEELLDSPVQQIAEVSLDLAAVITEEHVEVVREVVLHQNVAIPVASAAGVCCGVAGDEKAVSERLASTWISFAVSPRTSWNTLVWNCIESTRKPRTRVSAAMLEGHTRAIVRESHSSTLNLPLAPRDTSGSLR